MGFAVSLNGEDIAFAHKINELRKEYTTNHKPAHIRDGDLIGTTAEVAFCKHLGIPYESLGYDHGGGGDGGIDVILPDGTTLDVKSSADHPDSWLVKHPKHPDWYIFAWVEMPYTVHFLGKQRREFIARLPLFRPVRGARRVTIEDTIDISPTDFVFPVTRAA